MKIDIAEQIKVNDQIMLHLNTAIDEIKTSDLPCRRLRTCSAWVFETENYYVLKSYNTFIACIHKSSDILFDGLRIVYGYTSTSGQHIRKFSKDYGKAQYGVTHIMTGGAFE